MGGIIFVSVVFLVACAAFWFANRMMLRRLSWLKVLTFAFQSNARLVVFEAGKPPRVQIDGEFRQVDAPAQSAEHVKEIQQLLRASPTLSLQNLGVAVARRNEATLVELVLNPGESAARRG